MQIGCCTFHIMFQVHSVQPNLCAQLVIILWNYLLTDTRNKYTFFYFVRHGDPNNLFIFIMQKSFTVKYVKEWIRTPKSLSLFVTNSINIERFNCFPFLCVQNLEYIEVFWGLGVFIVTCGYFYCYIMIIRLIVEESLDSCNKLTGHCVGVWKLKHLRLY